VNVRTVKLIDVSRNVLATAQVADEGGFMGGTINLSSTPADVRALFDEFEEIVNGQMFSLLDEVQARIGALSIKAIGDDGCEAAVRDLQVFPTTGDVSFKLVEVPTQSAKSA
jgi:hypothetical protein